MKPIALLLLVVSSCCFAAGKPRSQLMAYDFNACADVVISEVKSIAYINSDDPSLTKAREHLGSPPYSNMLVGYAGALSAGRDDPEYRIYCSEHLDQRDSARRLQVICHHQALKIAYKPVSEFDGQNTFQCTTNCDKEPFKAIYEMSLQGEGYKVIPRQVKEMQRFRKCKGAR